MNPYTAHIFARLHGEDLMAEAARERLAAAAARHRSGKLLVGRPLGRSSEAVVATGRRVFGFVRAALVRIEPATDCR
jgi:hypothetical protein